MDRLACLLSKQCGAGVRTDTLGEKAQDGASYTYR